MLIKQIGIPIILVVRVPNRGNHDLHATTVARSKNTATVSILRQDEISDLSDTCGLVGLICQSLVA